MNKKQYLGRANKAIRIGDYVYENDLIREFKSMPLQELTIEPGTEMEERIYVNGYKENEDGSLSFRVKKSRL
jgi:hypothetical protein